MRIAGVMSALVGLLLLVPSIIIVSKLAVGDVNIDTKSLSGRFIRNYIAF
jgi:hypothetical protein